MSSLKLDCDDGLTTIEVKLPGQTEPVSVQLDVARTVNCYVRLSREHGEDTDALGEAWCAWLAERGLPGLPHKQGFQIADHAVAILGAAKKTTAASLTGSRTG
jgi:hypothetical protein